MAQASWSTYGLIYVASLPILSVAVLIIGEVRNTHFPPSILAAVFPLGLLFLALGPVVFRPGSRETPEVFTDFIRGSRYAMLATFMFSIPASFILGFFYNRGLLALSLLTITIGGLVLPDASVSGVSGYILCKGEEVDEFFNKAAKGSPVAK